MPVLDFPCPPCKVIINGGQIAALVPLLLDALPHAWTGVRDLVTGLGKITTAYTGMLAAMGVSVNVTRDTEGCAEARQMLTWIGDMSRTKPQDVVDKVEAWTSTYRAAIADLAAGKLPQ